MMNNTASNFFALTTFTKRFGRLLLPLPFCIFLISCDSPTSTTAVAHKAPMNQSLNDSKVRNTHLEDAAQMNSEGLASADEVSEDEGTSLIAAAKPDNVEDRSQTHRTPMISHKNADSALQAILIGDYTGILPCTFCSGISVTLNLFADGSVVKTSIYENPEMPKLPLVESGVYRQDNTMITIVYNNKDIESYQIQDSHLVMLNADKTLNLDYTLSRK